ncbi:MAG: hypothetical protein ACRD29_17955 [Acidimicrobiales bacterium]
MAERDEQMQERLDEVGRQIDRARERAEHDDLLIEDDEPRFHESGEAEPEEDDPTIAPG